MTTSTTKIGAALLLTTAFGGCAADEGRPLDPAVESTEATATQAAIPCQSVTSTLNAHFSGGRVTQTVTPFFIWQISAFYAKHDVGSPLPQEYLGADGNQVVTLYTVGSTYAWTAVQANCAPAPICGDGIHNASPGIIEGIEPCDGPDLDGKNCVDLGYSGGTLACKADCHFDVSRCQTQCGNGRREGAESCDGADTPAKTCAELDPTQYVAGTLKCAADCTYDVSGCTKGFCGDGIVNLSQGESCDGTNLRGFTTCASYDPYYSGGNLKCNSQCKLDLSGCTLGCGDGRINPEREECDGNLLSPPYPSFRCADYNYPNVTWPWNTQVKYASGTIKCDSNCKLNRFECKPPPGCYVACGTPGICVLECR